MSRLISAIQVKDFSFYFCKKKVIEGISMDIYENQVTAIIGSSGSGKSTFLKSLNRMSEIEEEVKVEGCVEFYGQNIYNPRINLKRLRRQISIVFPKPNLFPLSVYDNVAYGVKVMEWRPKAELDALVEFAIREAALWDELKNKLHKPALELSISQQQRLCIARALALKPTVLLMDEPCSELDPIATAKIEELIRSWRKKLTIVLVTKNMAQVFCISDFTAFFSINESRIGHLVEFGTTTQIFSNAMDSRTHEYISKCFR